jgi:recombination protein RecR
MYPKSVQQLADVFKRFPTIGSRTAIRFAFYVMKASDTEVQELLRAVQQLHSEITLCNFCFNPFEVSDDESKTGLCGICRDTTRDIHTLCIVEKESDLEVIEATHQYKGRYFLLGGVQDILKKEGVQNMRVQELKERIGDTVQEIIVALNPTAEGETAFLYLARMLEPLGKKVTRLARGLPMGGEIEYADEETIRSALEGRR